MPLSTDYKAIEVTLRPNSTIEALIRFHNDYNINTHDLKLLVDEFNMLNPDAMPPKPYQKVLMPVLNTVKTKENPPT